MNTVLILLSTYNGERFLREQLDSLFSQKGVTVKVLVRDDGSRDTSVSILEEYAQRTGHLIIIKGENVGATRSFLALQDEALKYEADYYAFCDQDDIWLEDKLITAVNILENKSNSDRPALYMSAYQMVDTSLNKISTAIKQPRLTLPSALISNCATGCTMVFNRSLLHASACVSEDSIIMHDYWMYLVCLALEGFVYYDTTPHILYRQHGNNVIGGLNESFCNRWATRTIKLFKPGDCYKSKLAKKLLFAKESQLSNENREYLLYASTCNRFYSKWKMLTNCENFVFSFDKNLQTIGLILTGKF